MPCYWLSIEGQGEEGYVELLDNIKYFYPGSMGADPSGKEEVLVNAEALEGYVFKEWDGDEKALCRPFKGLGYADIPEPLDGCEYSKIKIVMDKSHEVRPVFVDTPPPKALTVMGGDCNAVEMQSVCCIADVPLVNFGCVVTHIEPYSFSKTLLLEKIPDNEVFRFAGHGIVGDCIRVSDRDENNPANSALCSAEIPECNYNLVVINACRSAENSNFRSAFDANCFIGWRGDPTFAFVAKWEREFWKNLLLLKKSAQLAASLARTEAIGSQEGEPEATHVCEGDVCTGIH